MFECLAGQSESGFMSVATGWLHQSALTASNYHSGSHLVRSNLKSLDRAAAGLWDEVWSASQQVPHKDFVLPESRTDRRDWVRDGMHIPW